MKEKMHITILSLGVCALIGLSFAISSKDYKEKTPKLNSAPEVSTNSKKFECTKEAISETSLATKEYNKNLDKWLEVLAKIKNLGGNSTAPCEGLKGREKTECNINNVELKGLFRQIQNLEEKMAPYEKCQKSLGATQDSKRIMSGEVTTKKEITTLKDKKKEVNNKGTEKTEIDFEFKNITHKDGDDKYTYKIDFCVHGNYSIDDLKKNFPELQYGLPWQYSIIGNDGKILIKEPMLKISLNANKVKNGDCFNETIKIYTPDLERFDIAKKVIFEVDQDNIIEEVNEKNNVQELHSKDFCKTTSCQTTYVPTQSDINFDIQMKNGGFTIKGPIVVGKSTSEVMTGSIAEFDIGNLSQYGTFTYLCGKGGKKLINPDLPLGDMMGVFYCTYDKIGTKTVSAQRNGKTIATKSFNVIEKKDPEFPCKDTENGQDTYIQGSVTGLWYGQKNRQITDKLDQCKDSNTLYEYYCTEKTFRGDEPQIHQEEHICEYGCLQGACRKSMPEISVSLNKTSFIHKTYDMRSSQIPFQWTSTEYLEGIYVELLKDGAIIDHTNVIGISGKGKGGSEVLEIANSSIPTSNNYKIRICEFTHIFDEKYGLKPLYATKICGISDPFNITVTEVIEN